MKLRVFSILNFLAAVLVLTVVPGCSQDDAADVVGEVTFQNGDGVFECGVAGGAKTLSFLSGCGHWEIVPEHADADWVSVWPAYGDDNGKVTITVKAIDDAYGRSEVLNIVTARGIVGHIKVSQTGKEPFINLDLTSSKMKVDIAGTPIIVTVTSNVKWEASVISGEDWISLGETTETTQQFLFEDNSDQPKRAGEISFSMVGGDFTLSVPVEQMDGNTSFEKATEVTIAQLLSEVVLADGSFEVEENYAVKGWITSDFGHRNTPDSVLFVQDASGRGLKLLLKNKADVLSSAPGREGWFAQNRKIAIHMYGAEFRMDAQGNLAVVDFATAAVKSSEEESPVLLPVELSDFSQLADYTNTLVTVNPVEFVMPFGCYANFFEDETSAMTTVAPLWSKEVSAGYKQAHVSYLLYPQLMRDAQGTSVKAYFHNDFTQKWIKNVPAGAGAFTAVVSRFRDEYILQIRNSDDDRIDASRASRISTSRLKAGPWLNGTDAVPLFEIGNTDDDRSSIVFSIFGGESFSVKPVGSTGVIGAYWLKTAIRRQSATPWEDVEEKQYYALNANRWWNVTDYTSQVSNATDLGEAYVLRTNTLRNAEGSLYISLSALSSKGGPGYMKVQWTDSAEADLTKVTFNDIGEYRSPVADYTPYLLSYNIKLPDAMKGKANVILLIRCASQENASLKGVAVTPGGTTRLGSVEIVEVK